MNGNSIFSFLVAAFLCIPEIMAGVHTVAERSVPLPEATIKTRKPFTHISSIPILSLKGHRSFVHDIAFNNDVFMASAGGDSAVVLWNYRTGEQIRTIKGHNGYVYAVAFSPDGSLIASAGWDGVIRLWDSQTGALNKILGSHKEPIYDINFSPDGNRLVSASWDNTAKVWDKSSGELLFTLTGHGKYVSSAVFSPDGLMIATSSADGTAKLWDARNGMALQTFTGDAHMHWYCNRICFSPDGQLVAVSTSGGENPIYIWSLQGKRLHTLKGHSDFSTSAEFSKGGTRLASVSADNSLKLWNIYNSEQLFSARELHYFVSNAYNAAGDIIAACALDGTIVLWQAEQDGMPQARSGGEVTEKKDSYSVQAVPNPASSSVTITFTLPESVFCTVELLAQNGKHITTLYDNTAPVGSTSIVHDLQLLASGLYYITLTTPSKTVTCRLDVVK